MIHFSASAILLALSAFLNVPHYPVENSSWTITESWHSLNNGTYETTLKINADSLNCSNGKVIEFPNIIHASQFISFNGKLIYIFGVVDTFQLSQSFYGKPILNCNLIDNKGEIEWRIVSPSEYFSRFTEWPQIIKKSSPISWNEVLNVSVFGGLIIVAAYLIMFTWQTANYRVGISMSAFAIFMAIFFLISVAGIIEIPLQLIVAHKIADLSLGLAGISMIMYLRFRNLFSIKTTKILASSIGLCATLIIFSRSSDEIQLGTTLLFGPIGAVLWIGLYNQIKTLKKKNLIGQIQNIFGLSIFVLTSTSDIVYTFGIHQAGIVLPYGIIGSVFFFVQSLQQEVLQTYKERDYLQKNLELEVIRKTDELKIVQAELAQSAKLASLGTLAAGIAHEINNSVNYVNGALVPLEKILNQNVKDEEQKAKVNKLFTVMKDGVHLTVDIIRSLRNYTGLNQAQVNDLLIYEIVENSLTILRNETRNKIETKNEIDKNLKIYGNVTGLNQIFMNLISNAIDAMPNGGTLTFKSNSDENNIIITIQDTGKGIKPENLNRIFDPFFTTKEVGKGTGLGLHIVMTEISKCNGAIDVTSDVGRGTTFTLKFPISKKEESKGKAA